MFDGHNFNLGYNKVIPSLRRFNHSIATEQNAQKIFRYPNT